jgi:hypothetical protein
VERLGSISVDLDTLPHYCRIHGLPEDLLDATTRARIWTLALPRLLAAIEAVGARATLFAIGEDLDDPTAAAALRDAHQRGHEIASHSHTHPYALSRLSPEAIQDELDRAHRAIEGVTGVAPSGFRAPGYTLSAGLLQAVLARGYRYDSSTFPAVPYYLAKALVMGALSLLGRPSKAILDRPRVLLAPCDPYRPSGAEPYRRGDAALLELPMAVAPFTRLPFIGTFLTSAPSWLSRTDLTTLGSRPFLNLELHAVDALGADDGLPPALLRQQRDLRISSGLKMARMGRIFELLAARRKLLRLDQATEILARLR